MTRSAPGGESCLQWACFLLVLGSGSLAHVHCPPGTYADKDDRCAWCSPGTYQDETGARKCKPCRKGMISTEIAAASPRACQNCPQGTFATNLSSCVACPQNTISPAGAMDLNECIPRPGFYGRRGDVGVECPANNRCTLGTTRPTPCPGGTISVPGATECVPGVPDVLLYDWIVVSGWILLFVSAILCVGGYKYATEFWHRPRNVSPSLIKIKIIREERGRNGL